MGFNRVLLSKDAKLPQPMRAGDGLVANFGVYQGADAADTLTVADIAGGYVLASVTGARTYTLDTAANIAAAFDTMDIGDSFSFVVTVSKATNAVTVAVGTGITLQSGGGVVAPQSSRVFVLVKTGAATFDLF